MSKYYKIDKTTRPTVRGFVHPDFVVIIFNSLFLFQTNGNSDDYVMCLKPTYAEFYSPYTFLQNLAIFFFDINFRKTVMYVCMYVLNYNKHQCTRSAELPKYNEKYNKCWQLNRRGLLYRN